jgi:zinc transport system substrate-binding protein
MRFLLLILCLHYSAVTAAPRVVTSISPLQEIVLEIMAGIAQPEVVIHGEASAHHFAFKPSHMRLLQQADLVIWVDRHFETGFYRVSQVLPDTTRQLELLRELGVDSDDGHIWYSPRLLLSGIDRIVAALVEIDPAHQAKYRQNARRLRAQITDWHDETEAKWLNRRPRYITDHAFTTHFGDATGLAAIASVHDQHDNHGGIRELQQLEDLLRKNPANCLLTLEDLAPSVAANLAQKFQLRIIHVNQLPITRTRQPLIIQRLDRLISALQDCV